MPNSNLELQKAIVAALKADPAVTALVEQRVYGARPPDNAAVPFISFGPKVGSPLETQEMEGFEVNLQLDTHDRHETGSDTRCQQIMDAITAVLHNNEALALDNDNVVLASLDFERILMEGDGRSAHGVQRFRFITHPD